MTELTKPVTRVVAVAMASALGVRVRSAVTLTPEGIAFREKGRRTSYTIPYRTAYNVAARLAGLALMADRKARRKARKGALKHG